MTRLLSVEDEEDFADPLAFLLNKASEPNPR